VEEIQPLTATLDVELVTCLQGFYLDSLFSFAFVESLVLLWLKLLEAKGLSWQVRACTSSSMHRRNMT